MARRGSVALHHAYAPVVNVRDARALAEISLAMRIRVEVDGVQADLIAYTRLNYRIAPEHPALEDDDPFRPDSHGRGHRASRRRKSRRRWSSGLEIPRRHPQQSPLPRTRTAIERVTVHTPRRSTLRVRVPQCGCDCGWRF